MDVDAWYVLLDAMSVKLLTLALETIENIQLLFLCHFNYLNN